MDSLIAALRKSKEIKPAAICPQEQYIARCGPSVNSQKCKQNMEWIVEFKMYSKYLLPNVQEQSEP